VFTAAAELAHVLRAFGAGKRQGHDHRPIGAPTLRSAAASCQLHFQRPVLPSAFSRSHGVA
jgi:hypothetical protein